MFGAERAEFRRRLLWSSLWPSEKEAFLGEEKLKQRETLAS